MGVVEELRENEVELGSGQIFKFDYVVIATGARQAPPAKLLSSTKREECDELQDLQKAIREAGSIALVGGGAVGVQLAGDIKTFYPEGKRVTLIHSRSELLNSFESSSLHEYVVEKLQKLGVEVVLSERPDLGDRKEGQRWEAKTLRFKDGREEAFDLVVSLTFTHTFLTRYSC